MLRLRRHLDSTRRRTVRLQRSWWEACGLLYSMRFNEAEAVGLG